MRNIGTAKQLLYSLFICLLASVTTLMGSDNIHTELDHCFFENKELANDDTFHLISHGRPGELLIEGEWKNVQKISSWLVSQRFQFQYSHLNIYGCEFAKGPEGLEAISYLQSKLGVSVSASDDITGIDGDWEMEVGVRQVMKSLFDYKGNLQCTDPDMFADNCDFDGDGIINSIDIDDDNDGVLDDLEIECPITELLDPDITSTDYIVSGNLNSGLQDPILTSNSGWIPATPYDEGFSGMLFTDKRVEGITINGRRDQPNNYIREFTLQGTQDGGTTWIDIGQYPTGLSNDRVAKFIPIDDVRTWNGLRIMPVTWNGNPGVRYQFSLADICVNDDDGDGILNRFDLDSDGDGCSDAWETRATTNFETDYQFPNVDSNGDGLVDAVDPDGNGEVNYDAATNYFLRAKDSLVSLCPRPCTDPDKKDRFCDFDGDGILNFIDIDDDNDGVLDIVEQEQLAPSESFYFGPEYWASISWENAEVIRQRTNILPDGLIDGDFTASATTFCPIAGGGCRDDFSDTPIVITMNTTVPLQANAFGIVNDFGVIGDGIKRARITLFDSAGEIIALEEFDNLSSNAQLEFYEFPETYDDITRMVLEIFEGTLGGGVGTEMQLSEVGLYTSTGGFGDIDTDDDGMPNRLDLDSDDDGCSDAFESEVTPEKIPDFQFIDKEVGENGMVDSLETSPDSGEYNGEYTYNIALDSSIMMCCPEYTITTMPVSCFDSDGFSPDGNVQIDADFYLGDAVYTVQETGMEIVAGNDGSGLITGLEVGSYNLIITDNINSVCGDTIPFAITGPADPFEITSVDTINAVCNDEDGASSDGQLTDVVTVNGGMIAMYELRKLEMDGSVTMIGTSTTPSFADLEVGSYEVTAVDADGCEARFLFMIEAPMGLTLMETSVVDLLCYESMDGSIAVESQNSEPPLGYMLIGNLEDGSQVNRNVTGEDMRTFTFDSLPAGSYSIVLMDDNMCTQSISNIIVNQPDDLEISAVLGVTTCEVGDIGSVDVSVVGGTAPYSYLWSTGSTAEDLNGLVAGTYTVMVTDANDCELEASYTVQESCVDIVKSTTYVSPAAPQAGDVIAYELVVTNTGEVTLSNLMVTDDNGVIVSSNTITELLSGVSGTVMVEHMITQAELDAGEVLNSADVTGRDTDDNVVDAEDDLRVPLTQLPGISIRKSATKMAARLGDVIEYEIVVENTGNVTLSDIDVNDLNSEEIDIADITELLPGVIMTFTATHIITQEDLNEGLIINKATASYKTPNDDETGESNQVEVTLEQEPGIALRKISEVSSMEPEEREPLVAGDTIRFDFVVENTGNITLYDIFIEDPKAMVNGAVLDSLVPGQIDSTTFSAIHILTQMDVDAGVFVNLAKVTGYTSEGIEVTDDSDDPLDTEDEDDNGDGDPDDPTETPLVQGPGIRLEKSGQFENVVGDSFAQVGDRIVYTFTVYNTGNVSLFDIFITDDLVNVTVDSIDLEPNENDGTTFTGFYELTQTDIDSGFVFNQALVTGTTQIGQVVTDLSDDPQTTQPNDGTVVMLAEDACLDLEKIGEVRQDFDQLIAGDEIVYTYEVRNCGNVSLSGTVISEPAGNFSGVYGDLSGVSVVSPTDLEVGEVGTATARYIINQSDIEAGEVVNQAEVRAVSSRGSAVEDMTSDDSTTAAEDDPTVIPLTQVGEVTLLKSSDLVFDSDPGGNPNANAGDTVYFEFTIINTGNVNLSDLQLSDDAFSGSGSGIDIEDISSGLVLAPGESIEVVGSYVLTQIDIDNNDAGMVLTNQAEVVANSVLGEVSDLSDSVNSYDETDSEEDETTTPFEAQSCIEVIKFSSIPNPQKAFVSAGDVVVYDYEYENCGDVTLSGVVIQENVDDFSGSGGLPVVGDYSATVLSPGQSGTARAEYVLTQADIDSGEILNRATIRGTDPSQEEVRDISDSGNFPDMGTSMDVTIQKIDDAPCITVYKEALFDNGSDGVDTPGDTIGYRIVALNCGNTTLKNVRINDINFTGSGELGDIVFESNSLGSPLGTLLPEEEGSYSILYGITQQDIDAGFVENQVTAEGVSPQETMVIDVSDDNDDVDGNIEDDPTVVPLENEPCVSIEKSSVVLDGGDGRVDMGDTIVYTIEVMNCGNVSLSEVVVTDTNVDLEFSMSSQNSLPGNLLVGESATYVGNYIIGQSDIDAGMVENQAMVMATDPRGEEVEDTSDEDMQTEGDQPLVTLIDQQPMIDLTKRAILPGGTQDIEIGDTVLYELRVRNIGNTTLTEVELRDSLFTGTGVLDAPSFISSTQGSVEGTLLVNEQAVYEVAYELTLEDINAGLLSNQDTVRGISPMEVVIRDISDDGGSLGDGVDDITTIMVPVEPCISLLKQARLLPGVDGRVDAGDMVEYTFTVRNCGQITVDSLVINELADGSYFTGSNGIPVADAFADRSIDPGQEVSTTALYTLSQLDINTGFVENQAIAQGVTPTGIGVEDESDNDVLEPADEDPTVVMIEQERCVSLLKGSVLRIDEEVGFAVVGDEIEYDFTIVNCGNVSLYDLELTEVGFTGTNGLPQFDGFNGDVLEPGISIDVEARYRVNQDDLDLLNEEIENQARVDGVDLGGIPVQDFSDSTNAPDENGTEDDKTITPYTEFPCIELIKTSSLPNGDESAAGDEIVYTYDVRNCGNVTLREIAIVELDSVFTGLADSIPVVELPNDLVLAPEAEYSTVARYRLTQSDFDMGQILNQAMARGESNSGGEATDLSDSGNFPDQGTADDITVSALPQNPCIELIKGSEIETDDNGLTQNGQAITYDYVIKNCGNVSLFDIELTEMADVFTGNGVLPRIEETEFNFLAVGDSVFTRALYTVEQEDILQESVVNQALATGRTNTGVPIRDLSDSSNANDLDGDDDPTVQPILRRECLDFTKQGAVSQGPDCITTVGDTIIYNYVISNCGNVDLTDFTFEVLSFDGTGAFDATIDLPVNLAGNNSYSTSNHYVITQEDIDSLLVTNVDEVTAIAFDTLLRAQDDAVVDVEQLCPAVVCNGNVQISLGSDCGGIRPSDLLGGKLNIEQTLEITDENGEVHTAYAMDQMSIYTDTDGNPFDWSPFIGQDITFKIVSSCDGNSCWGSALIEVKIEPKLTMDCMYLEGVSQTVDLQGVSDGGGATAFSVPFEVSSLLELNVQKWIDMTEGSTVQLKYGCQSNTKSCESEGTLANISYQSDTLYFDIINDLDQGSVFTTILQIEVMEYVECEAVCGSGASTPFSSVDEVKRALNAACVPVLLSDPYYNDRVDERGGCSDALYIRDWYIDYELKGEKVSGLLFTQAYRTTPLDFESLLEEPIVKEDGNPYLDMDGNEVYRVMFPGSFKGATQLDCTEELSLEKTGYPKIWNYNGDAEDVCDTLEVHYRRVSSIEEKKISIIGQDGEALWSVIPVVNKEIVGATFCGNEELEDFRRFIRDLEEDISSGSYEVGTAVEIVSIGYQNGNTLVENGQGMFDYIDIEEMVYDFRNIDSLVHFITEEKFERGFYAGQYKFNSLAYNAGGLEDVSGYWDILSGESYCNLLITYSDSEVYESCSGGDKFIRTWQIVDWCNNEKYEDSQVIEVGDNYDPEVVSSPAVGDTVVVYTDVWRCTVLLDELSDLVEFEDNCTDSVRVSRYVEGYGDELDIGVYTVNYVGEDACGNRTVYPVIIEVTDGSAPVAVCHESVTVSLSYSENEDTSLGTVFAHSFDNDSFDGGCGDVSFSVIRQDDIQTTVLDCSGNEYYIAQSCHAVTQMVDLGHADAKGACVYDGTNMREVAVVSDHVYFCCEDVANDSLLVELRIRDDYGNENRCWSRVEVQNKSESVCRDETIELSCADDLSSMKVPGTYGSCETASLLYEDEGSLECGKGDLVRYWIVDKDGDGVVDSEDTYACKTVIRVEEDVRLDPYSIKWPKHYDGMTVEGLNLECDEDSVQTVGYNHDVKMGDAFECVIGEYNSEVVYCKTDCSLVGYTQKRDTIFKSPTCYTILVHHELVDWCSYSANGEDEDVDASDVFEAIEDWSEGECSGCDIDGRAIGEDEGHVYFRYKKVDRDGYYNYTQKVKVVDHTSPEIEIQIADTVVVSSAGSTKGEKGHCTSEATLRAEASDFCGSGQVIGNGHIFWEVSVYDKDGELLESHTQLGSEFTQQTEAYGLGSELEVVYRVRDACGNVGQESQELVFVDREKPTVFCVSGLSMSIDDHTAIWPSDIDFGTFDGCEDSEDLVYGLTVKGGDFSVDSLLGGSYSSYDLSCAAVGDAVTAELTLYAADKSGNYGYCNTAILIRKKNCESTDDSSSFTSGGSISSMYGMGLGEVEVGLSSNQIGYPRTTQSDGEGNYSFANLAGGYNYIIQPEREQIETAGISSLDILLIQAYIVGRQEMESPYQLIAADANGDEKVSSVDIVEIKKYLLGTAEGFSSKPWRFVDASQRFYDDESPWPLDESVNVYESQADRLSHDFIGIKVGDVNGNSMRVRGIENRSTEEVELRYEVVNVEEGDRLKIPITTTERKSIEGLQLEIVIPSGLKDVSLEGGVLDIDEDDYHIDSENGIIRIVWHSERKEEKTDQAETLFTLVGEVGSKKSEEITLEIKQSRWTSGVVIAGDEYDVELLRSSRIESQVSLDQNRPNPFERMTQIGFSTDEGREIHLEIYDIHGRQVYENKGYYPRGRHTLEVNVDDLGSAGIYHYRIAGTPLMKRLIIID